MDIVGFFKKRADPRIRIALPEAEDERYIIAIKTILKNRIATPILLGNRRILESLLKKHKMPVKKIKIIDPSEGIPKNYITEYKKIRKQSGSLAEKMLSRPIFYAAIMVRLGDADSFIGGAVETSATMETACNALIGLEKGISVPSSIFIMEIPGYEGGEKGLLVFADCSVTINPTAEELADIAVTTAKTVKTLLGWEPKIAMLSFSTKGSASSPEVEKVARATALARRRMPETAIDGEMQGDSALVADVAKRKIPGGPGKVGGKANILIFPDLNSGNIAYKLVHVLGNAPAYGPVLQGYAKPVSDLSRGARPEEMAGVAAILSSWVNSLKRGKR